MFSAINTAALPILIASTATPLASRFTGAVALVVCMFWAAIHHKTQGYINHWESVLRTMEPSEGILGVIRVFTGGSWEEANKRPNFYHLLFVLPGIFIGVWSIVFLYTFPEIAQFLHQLIGW